MGLLCLILLKKERTRRVRSFYFLSVFRLLYNVGAKN